MLFFLLLYVLPMFMSAGLMIMEVRKDLRKGEDLKLSDVFMCIFCALCPIINAIMALHILKENSDTVVIKGKK